MSDLFAVAYNPDVLSCLANLSNDEVFTPPEVVNQMLDMLPAEIWSDKNATFLDPACKSGVFLREIAKRLIEAQLPNYEQISYEIKEKLRAGGELDGRDIAFQNMLQDVTEHVFKNQVFGIAITELTSLLSRRSVYCSKYPQSEYSVVRFDNPEGRIDYKQMQHTWKNGKCIYCGASESEYNREEGKEQYAYEFIHLDTPEEVFEMKFDVIIGNPPYQMGVKNNDSKLSNEDKVERSNRNRDKPIYNLFIEQAKKLNPRYLVMIIPSRWMASGLGLSNFRQEMLADRHIRKLVDFPVSSDVFAGVEIKAGVCYFLWDRDNQGPCETITVRNAESSGSVVRYLDEYDVLVRDSRALPILQKVLKLEEPSITEILSVDKEFGWTSNFDGFSKKDNGGIPLYYNRKGRRKCGWVERSEVQKSTELIDTWKVLVPQAGSDGGQKIPDRVLGAPFIAPSPSVCTQTYLFFYLSSRGEAENLESYLRTKFFRFLVSLRKLTQHATRSTYLWVPMQDFSKEWTDEELYDKYGLSENERSYIETTIKSMDLDD